MRGGLIDDACQCAKLLGAGGYSRVVQRICHLGFSFGRDFMGETIREARSSCQQDTYLLLNTPFRRLLAASISAVYPVSRDVGGKADIQFGEEIANRSDGRKFRLKVRRPESRQIQAAVLTRNCSSAASC